ncbi:MAG: chromate transporter [Clostridia bacterium]|nr:chromate transporter [Clostridia bacterium]
MNTRMDLFLTFSRIGLFTFGGGYAMIPLIQREAVEHKHWISDEELLDVLAIAESTPGPIAINCATFIGRKVARFGGALCATLGVVLPSFVIIALLSFALQTFAQVRIVRYAFWGIRAGVLAMILKALWKMFKQCRKDWFAYSIMALALAASAFFGLSAVLIIAACAILGILYLQIGRAKP